MEAMLGDDGLLVPLMWLVSFEGRAGTLRDVRELLKEERRFVKLRSLRTPFGLRSAVCGEDEYCAAEAGEVGVRKLSVLCLFDSDSISSTGFSLFISGGVVGWEFNGPPPGVGGSAGDGDRYGDSAGGGMLVPAVRL